MNEEQFHSGFVSIVGRPNVGKSTLLNSILGQKIAITTDKPQTTRNRILGIYSRDALQVSFLDTPGIHRPTGRLNRYMVDQAVAACSGVDLVAFVVDASEGFGKGDRFILDLLKKNDVPVFLVLNKIDLLDKESLLPLIDSLSQLHEFAEIFPLSALDGDGVERLLERIGEFMPEGPAYYPDDMVTDLPERFIVAEMIREQLLLQTRDEVPYGVAVEVETFEEKPEKSLVVIGAAVNVERESQKRIIVGKQGARIKSVGRQARLEIETLLGCRVFLELFVKVQKNWTESERHLRRFGYD